MWNMKKLLGCEMVRLLIGCLTALGGGYLLSIGTVCGVVSPLAAALAGICSPLYAFCILFGGLLAYWAQNAPGEMYYLLTSLVCIVCMRILFYEAKRPHILAVLTAVSCSIAGAVVDLFIAVESGFLPLYIMEALLIGVTAFFLADAWSALCRDGKICLDPGKSFTFALSYLLGITALCGLDLPFCNAGRIAGIVVTLLAARHFRQSGGTLLGALTACGAVLCSVRTGMPLLFLPVTAMLAGFLNKLPNALYIPVFFLMQLLSSAVLDSSAELAKVLAELVLSSCIYALCSHAPFYRIITFAVQKSGNGQCVMQREQFLSQSVGSLRAEMTAVIRHLRPVKPADAVIKAREQLCAGCKNEDYCWRQRQEKTEAAFRQLLHYPGANPGPEAMRGCIRRGKMTECFQSCSQRAALEQTNSVHLYQNRNIMLEYFSLMEEVLTDAAKQREMELCMQETEGFRDILHQCRCEYQSCFVHRLRCGRYAAEIYAKGEITAIETVRTLLTELLHVKICTIPGQNSSGIVRYCFYQEPAFRLMYEIRSIHAPGYARCGDTADAFTDGEGNQYLVLSDGMGSGSPASLVSQIAVRAFIRLVSAGMPPETVIRLVNTMLLSETNTESFATLDVLCLNADTGELRLYKSGASATLFQHGGQVSRIASASFPIGIVARAEPFCKTLPALEHDRIILLSDGIHEAEFPFMKELLLRDMSLADVVKLACEKAAVFHAGKAEDDITVAAAEICSTASGASTVMKIQEAAV